MSAIQSVIAMTDNMSPVVKAVTRNTNALSSSCRTVESVVRKMDSTISGASGGMGNFSSSVNGASGAVDSFISSSVAKFGILSAAIFGVYQAIKQVSNFMSGAMNLSDEYSQTNARLNLMNDGLQSTKVLQNEIFKSAQRTGQQYSEMADFVGKLGLLAGNAFSSNRETVVFAEQISKHLKIAGTETAAAQGSMLQLQQALSMGVLRGQEYNSVIQGMPTVIQAIEKELGVTRKELKEMADDGQISADIVKRAILKSIDETNAKFQSMPVTFEMAMNQIGNVANKAFEPVWEALGSIANNKNLQNMLDSLMPALNVVAALVAGTIYNFKALASATMPIIQSVFGTFGTIAENTLNMVSTLFSATFPIIIGLLAGYAAYWALANRQMIIQTAISAGVVAWQGILAAATWAVTTAKAAWAAVTRGVILAQIILGVVLATLSSPILVIGALIVGAIAIFSAWAAAGGNLREVLASAFEGIVNATEWMVNSSVKLINLLISAYNKAGSVLGKVLGFEFTEVGKVEYQADFSGFRNKYAGAIRDGTLLDTIQGDLGLKGFGMSAGADGFDSAALQALQDTADNTKGMKKAMEITDEDLKYLRDIAERDFIQQYQVAEIRVDMSGMSNHITQEAEVQDIASVLRDTIEEEMMMSAEGVHF